MFEFYGSISKDICNGKKPFRVRYGDKVVEVNSFNISFGDNSISEMLGKIDINDFDEITIKRKYDKRSI